MTIRNATPKDAKFIAPLILLVMKNMVYKFIDETDYSKAKSFLELFIKREDNQYSYQNCWVAEEENDIIAVVNVYDGAKLQEFRQPILEYIKKHFNITLQIEDETQAGEFYIDAIGVREDFQGKGIGSEMLKFLIDLYVKKNDETLGLLVDEINPKAKKLYLKLGFKSVGKKTLLGHNLDHLQIKG